MKPHVLLIIKATPSKYPTTENFHTTENDLKPKSDKADQFDL